MMATEEDDDGYSDYPDESSSGGMFSSFNMSCLKKNMEWLVRL